MQRRTPADPRRPLPARPGPVAAEGKADRGDRVNRVDRLRRGARIRRPARLPRPASGRELLVATAVFAVATLVLTYPLSISPSSLGRFDNGDARLNAWAISWVAHQVIHDPLHLFDANIFHPYPKTLAFSEHLFVPGLMALPLLLITDDLVLSYNLVLLAAIFLSALGMYLLTSSLAGGRAAAILAGLFFSFAAFRFNRLPHLQMQLYAFLPLTLLCLHRFFASGKRGWAWGSAAFFVLQVLSGTYLAAIAAVAVLMVVSTFVVGSGRSRAELLGLALAFGVGALCIYPFARPYLWVNEHLGIEWDLAGIESLSATPESYLAASSHLYRPLTDNWVPEDRRRDFLFPGLTLPVLALLGLVVLVTRKVETERPRITAVCYVLILSAGVVLSLGPQTPVYAFLHEHVVFFRGLRALGRFALLPLLSLSLLAGYGLTWLFADGWLRDRKWAAWVFGAFFIAESTALPHTLEPFRDEPPEVYTWLARDGAPGPIVELPFLVLDTRYMFWGRHHGFRQTLNGDSGFVPSSHRWMKNLLLRFPSPDSIALLRRLQVRYVILHLGAYRAPALIRLLNGLETHRAELLKIRDFDRDLVLEVVPSRAPGRPPLPQNVLPTLGGPTALVPLPGDSVAETVISFSAPRRVTGVRLLYGPTPVSPVTRAELLLPAGSDDEAWEVAWTSPGEWPALTELVLGLIEHPDYGSQTLTFETSDAFQTFSTDTIKLRLTGYEGAPDVTTTIEILGAEDPS